MEAVRSASNTRGALTAGLLVVGLVLLGWPSEKAVGQPATVAPAAPSSGAKPEAASSARPEAPKAAAEKKGTWAWTTEAWFKDSLLGLLAAGLGAFGAWWLQMVSAHAAAKRQFATEVTKQISTLATEHYWSLATRAGVLAGRLEAYLQSHTYHLILVDWARDRSGLRERLNEIAEEYAKNSFPHFCRLISLFDAFQFRQSNTYLLTNHAAGETCKRLYNMFIGSLPASLNLANLLEKQVEVTENGKLVTKKVRDLTSAALTEQIVQQCLEPERREYAAWLRHNAALVATAASALRAYNEVLGTELALLYKDWFKGARGGSYAWQFAYDRWPKVLSAQSLDTIRHAEYQTVLLRPLGAAMTPSPSSKTEPAKHDREMPTSKAGAGLAQVGDTRRKGRKTKRQEKAAAMA